MTLFDKYIKSATFNATYTQRFGRILFLFCLTIWILGLIWFYVPIKQGFIGLTDYFKRKDVMKSTKSMYANFDKYDKVKTFYEINIYDTTLSEEEWSILKNKNKPIPTWLEERAIVGINRDEHIDQELLDESKEDMKGLYAIPVYFILFFVFPWLILKLIFWIKIADNVKKV